ncbi:hypothetical protein D3C85_1684410 [compost metagenome]
MGNITDGSNISGDIITFTSITTSYRPNKLGVFVSKADRQTIKFQFANILKLITNGFSNAIIEITKVLLVIGIT